MSLPETISVNREDFQNQLLSWYKSEHRKFPWRQTYDPYEVLIAEKLLQQTKARKLVVDIYLELIGYYPSPGALAQADLDALYKLIEPLGLRYRANELMAMATEIVQRHHGVVPADLKDLLQLSGVGQYCARAVICFAYKQPVAIVDTNVARWLHRLCGITEPLPANPARKKYLYELMTDILPEESVRDFNLAILDLCALVCRSSSPKCYDCPLQGYCSYGHHQLTARNTYGQNN